MLQINCHIPIRLRIAGEPGDEQLEQLRLTLTRALHARIELAERTVAARFDLGAQDGATELRERFDPERAEPADEAYSIPSFNGGGRAVSMRLRETARGRRPWLILRAINVHARIGDFLDFIASLRPDETLEDKVLYADRYDELRWVSLWLVQVNQDYTLEELEDILVERAQTLSRVRDNQILAYGMGTTESVRQRLIGVDQDGRVSRDIPSIAAHNARRVFGSGPTSQVYAGGWVLFASMVLPRVDLFDVAPPGVERRILTPLRDLAFIVPPDRFMARYGIAWPDYAAEWGGATVTLRVVPIEPARRVHRLTLEHLLAQYGREALDVERGDGAEPGGAFGRLFVLNPGGVAAFPAAARSQVEAMSDPATRALSDSQAEALLEPGWKLAFAFAELPIDVEMIGAARHRPEARRLAPLLLARLIGDEDDRDWQWGLRDFLADRFGDDPPERRPAGGSVFEYVLAELEAGGALGRLFDRVEASGSHRLLHLLVRLARATRYAAHERVRAAYELLNRRYNEGWDHIYRVEQQEIWIDREESRRVRVGEIIATVNSLYSVERDEQRVKEASLPKLQRALEQEGQELLRRILMGQETREFSDEEFALAAFEGFRSHPERYNFGEDDLETVTVDRSARLLGIEVREEESLRRIYVTYELVERVGDAPWSAATTVPNSRRTKFVGSFTGIGDGFDQMLWFWAYNKAAVVVEYFAIGVSALALVAVAWEVGLVAGAVELAGGWGVVGLSVGISVGLYMYRVIFRDERFTWRGFFTAVLDGYLGALAFRGASLVGGALAGRIGTASLERVVVGWIAEKLAVGAVGGASTGLLLTFSHDLINIAAGTGGWSSAGQYVEHMEDGAVLGIFVELFVGAAAPLLRVGGRSALESGTQVIQALREGRLSGLRWMVEVAEGLRAMRRALEQVAQPGAAEQMLTAFRERLLRITQGIGGEYRLALFRRVLELNPGVLSRETLEGLERLLQTPRADLSNESVLALMNGLSAAQLRTLLEAMGTLEAGVVQALARQNHLATIVTTDLRAARLAAPGHEVGLTRIAARLRAEGHAGQLETIERVAGQPRIVGFADWVAESAGREAARMLDKVMELAAARRLFAEYAHDPSIVVRIGQDARTAGRSFDITVERLTPGAPPQVLRSIEVYTPDAAVAQGRDLIGGVAHAAEKIPVGVRDGTVALPAGAREGTIAVRWPPPPVEVGGDARLVFEPSGAYSRRSIADPTVTRGRGGNLLDDTVRELNRRARPYENPVEFVQRLTVIDQNGRALFELVNTNPGQVPMRWIWRPL